MKKLVAEISHPFLFDSKKLPLLGAATDVVLDNPVSLLGSPFSETFKSSTPKASVSENSRSIESTLKKKKIKNKLN